MEVNEDFERVLQRRIPERRVLHHSSFHIQDVAQSIAHHIDRQDQ